MIKTSCPSIQSEQCVIIRFLGYNEDNRLGTGVDHDRPNNSCTKDITFLDLLSEYSVSSFDSTTDVAFDHTTFISVYYR
jgi:hypothetical protein